MKRITPQVAFHIRRNQVCLKLAIKAGDLGYHKAQHMLIMMKNWHKHKALEGSL